MPSGPGALLGADVLIADTISSVVTVGHCSLGSGGIGSGGGASGGGGNMAFRNISQLALKSVACCPSKFRIGVLSTRLGLVYLYALKTSFPLAVARKVLQSACLSCRIAWKYTFLDAWNAFHSSSPLVVFHLRYLWCICCRCVVMSLFHHQENQNLPSVASRRPLELWSHK